MTTDYLKGYDRGFREGVEAWSGQVEKILQKKLKNFIVDISVTKKSNNKDSTLLKIFLKSKKGKKWLKKS